MSDWIWLAAMLIFGLQMFIIGTSVDTTRWPQNLQAFWWGMTHPFGPPPPWWSERRRQDWFNENGKPWARGDQ